MSKGLSAIFNELSGTLGNTVASPGPGGITYLRAKPLEVNQPNSPAQQKQKTRFSLVQSLAAIMLVFIRSSFKKLKPTHSEYNSFMSINTKALSDWDDTSSTDPYTLMATTRGSLAQSNATMSAANPPVLDTGVLTFDYLSDYDENDENLNPEDELMFVCVAPESGAIRTGACGVQRSEVNAEVNINVFQGVTSYVAIYFRSPLDGSVSSSKFAVKLDGNATATLL